MSFLTLPPDITWADEIFDGMMVCRAAIYRQDQTQDSSGNLSSTLVELTRDVPCFVKPMGGKELNAPASPGSETSFGIATYTIFMRPVTVDSPAVKLNNHHWLQILSKSDIANSVDYSDPSDPLAKTVLYNITNISDIGFMGHHLEISATVLEP